MLNRPIHAHRVWPAVGAFASQVSFTSRVHVRTLREYAVPLQVSVPANNLTGVALNSRAQVTVAQGFTARDFSASVNGSGNVYALGVSTEALTVNLRG